jgi:tRNA(Ile2) C34 agmatinyltransferase TiaS
VDEVLVRLEEQYNRSKVVKLFNFILKEIPKCAQCDGLRMHLIKEGNNATLKCKDC